MSITIWSKDKHLGRFRQIAEVLARHGLGYLADSVGLERFAPPQKLEPNHRHHDGALTRPEHLRMMLEEMGVTFIKLGQLLSTRPDLLPPEYMAELAKLQDDAPPVPSDLIKERIFAELGQPVEILFSEFDTVPLAAASIGQAHAATLFDGTEVVVKVRRPGAIEQVEEDLEILQNLAAVAARHWEFAEQYDLIGLAQEFAQTLRAELDYISEGRNAERFASNFAAEPLVHIPRVCWEQTTSRVLTMERIRGIKINDLIALDMMGADRRALAERGTEVFLKMVFEDGFFHADLHPGNLFVEEDGRFGLIDFGMVGTVDERTQERLAGLIMGITSQDYDRLADVILELGATERRHAERDMLRRDLVHLISPLYGQPLSEIKLGAILSDSFAVIRRHHLRLPPNLALLIKTVIMTEGIGANLDPTFNLLTVVMPYAERLMLRQYSPSLWLRRIMQASLDVAQLGVEMPQQLRRIMGEIERGDLQIGMRPEKFEPLIMRLERAANRIVLGLIASAFIIGLAVLLAVYRPPGWERWGWAFFAFGFLCALALGIYLTWSILRSRHR